MQRFVLEDYGICTTSALRYIIPFVIHHFKTCRDSTAPRAGSRERPGFNGAGPSSEGEGHGAGQGHGGSGRAPGPPRGRLPSAADGAGPGKRRRGRAPCGGWGAAAAASWERTHDLPCHCRCMDGNPPPPSGSARAPPRRRPGLDRGSGSVPTSLAKPQDEAASHAMPHERRQHGPCLAWAGTWRGPTPNSNCTRASSAVATSPSERTPSAPLATAACWI